MIQSLEQFEPLQDLPAKAVRRRWPFNTGLSGLSGLSGMVGSLHVPPGPPQDLQWANQPGTILSTTKNTVAGAKPPLPPESGT